MSVREHVELLRAGTEAIRKARQANPDLLLDLSGEDLSGIILDGVEIGKANFDNANLTGASFTLAQCSGSRFVGVRLQNAIMRRAVLDECIFHAADLGGANFINASMRKVNVSAETNVQSTNFTEVDFDGSILRGVRLDVSVLTRAKLTGIDFSQANFGGMKAYGASFVGSDLSAAQLSNSMLSVADLSGVSLAQANLTSANCEGANFSGANLSSANCSSTNFRGANLSSTTLYRAGCGDAIFDECNINGTEFSESRLSSASMRGIKNSRSAKHLQESNLSNGDARYFETAKRAWPEMYVDWERLRTFGQLPLFGASYVGLVTIPIYVYLLEIYNANVKVVREWVSRTLPSEAAPPVLDKLHPLPMPESFSILLTSTLLLAIASTIYALACPTRIKAYSKEQWCYELNRSLLHYWPEAWRLRTLRLICCLCYLLGGLSAGYIIATKLWWVSKVLWRGA